VLLVAMAFVLSAICATQVVRKVYWAKSLAVERSGDLLPQPARININSAASYELQMLPGIGPKTANAIVQYRQEHGSFASLEALADVKGIGPNTVERIRPHAMCAPVDEQETE